MINWTESLSATYSHVSQSQGSGTLIKEFVIEIFGRIGGLFKWLTGGQR